jgi:hypothetical protein
MAKKKAAPTGRKSTKRKGMSKMALKTAEIVAVLRQLRERMALVEEFEPDNRMLREYRHMRGWVIIELRRLRLGAELELHRQDVSVRERKTAAEHLHLIALVESEFESSGDTAR